MKLGFQGLIFYSIAITSLKHNLCNIYLYSARFFFCISCVQKVVKKFVFLLYGIEINTNFLIKKEKKTRVILFYFVKPLSGTLL